MSICEKTTTLIFLDVELVLHLIDGTCVSSSSSYIMTDGQSASLSWYLAPFGAGDQMSHFFEWQLLFLFFSYRAPSLTRGQVCNLQCNDRSSIWSCIATDSLLASSFWCRPPMGPMTKFYFLCLTVTFILLNVGLPHPCPPWTGWYSRKSKSKVKSYVSVGRNF
jgi:hypothetical protein